MKHKYTGRDKYEIVRLKDRLHPDPLLKDHYGWEYFNKIKAFRGEVSCKLKRGCPLRNLGELRK